MKRFHLSKTNCELCIRWSVMTMGLVITVCGALCVSVGAWSLSQKSFMQCLLRNSLFLSTTYVVLVAGCLVTFFSPIGIIGAYRSSKFQLYGYGVFLLAMMSTFFLGGMLGQVYASQAASDLAPEMMYSLQRVYNPTRSPTDATNAWDTVQSQLGCCGMVFPSANNVGKPWLAWRLNSKINRNASDIKVPSSCCVVDSSGEATSCDADNPVDVSKIYTDDCFVSGLAFVTGHAQLMGNVAFGMACVLALGLVLAFAHFKLIIYDRL